jgi:hypothetical protein
MSAKAQPNGSLTLYAALFQGTLAEQVTQTHHNSSVRALLIISAQVFKTRPWLSTTDWLKLNPFKLNAIVDKPKAVNQIPITGQAAKKKCNERELLKEAYWKIKRPK